MHTNRTISVAHAPDPGRPTRRIPDGSGDITPETAPGTALDAAPTPDLLVDFKANPTLFAAKLVRTMNRNVGVERDVRLDLAAALDRAAVEATDTTRAPRACEAAGAPARRARALAGPITITRNRTSASTSRSLSLSPTAADMAALLAGEHLAHDLLASGMPDSLAAQNDAIAHYADPIYKAYELRKLERRGVQVAEAAARHFLNHGRPATGLVFTRTSHLARWYAEQRDLAELAGPSDDAGEDQIGFRDPSAARLLNRPRLAWAHPAGLQHGLLLDRFHATHQRGAIERDSWIRRKVTEDLASIDALLRPANVHADALAPGDANLGVRVHAHRAPNVGVHFLPDYVAGGGRPVPGDHHRIGGCEHCATRPTLPNTLPSTRSTTRSTTQPTPQPSARTAAEVQR